MYLTTWQRFPKNRWGTQTQGWSSSGLSKYVEKITISISLQVTKHYPKQIAVKNELDRFVQGQLTLRFLREA
ncbi:hypothetical protein CYMTET_20378 [Cymbomonas tetramitiformis]|uniref:Uncharacterized protein n=1 Tax=Cymbomonas tetramitiformis TaxID=36881 RepID=A0AAE0L421_9CHLO|nr:hypothetical protein CYMTET_20378 [Cymbomonas tetramitiformis]